MKEETITFWESYSGYRKFSETCISVVNGKPVYRISFRLGRKD